MPYGQPSVWTKGDKKRLRKAAGAPRRSNSVAAVASKALSFTASGLGAAVCGIVRLARRSRAALIVMIAALAVAAGALVDLGFNWGKIYAGVHVGDVDLSGKTEQEAFDLLAAAYDDRLSSNEAVIFASRQEAASCPDAADGVRLSAQPEAENLIGEGRAWVANASLLAARLDTEGMVSEAFSVGRDEGGLIARLQAAFGGWSIAARAVYGENELEAFASGIDDVVGEPRVDFNVAVEDGVASVSEGHDGTMIDRDALKRELDGVLLSEGDGKLVADAQYAPLRIDEDAARFVCDQVNAALSRKVTLTAAGYVWTVDAADLGSWVVTTIEQEDGSWVLLPRVDAELSAPSLLAQSMKVLRDGIPPIAFERDGKNVRVLTDGSGSVPDTAKTSAALDEALFAQVRQNIVARAHAEKRDGADGGNVAAVAAEGDISLEAVTQPTPRSLSFEDALAMGLVEEISAYTTTYRNEGDTANRVNNIHLAADLLNDSIAKASGGTWSFYDTTGECNAEAGFLGAGTIVEGEHQDAVGGGICQVATTVFNAVYESGFPVVYRYNHTLRMTNYPDGRDAAVSWPDLDLVWKNDCSSDVLVRCSYTDTSLTVTLYGTNPGYTVSTKTGEWQAGDAYRTRVECDESMAEGASYVKTPGVDGSSITVWRTVRDKLGNVLHEDKFVSKYDSETKVVVAGPGTKIEVGDEELVASPEKPVTSKKVAAAEQS